MNADAVGRRRRGLVGAVVGALRYRFFLLAGAFPYLLGAAVAYRYQGAGAVDWWLLSIGLAGIVFVAVGIEGMNEYFDSRIGGDRVFASEQRQTARWHLPVGLSGFGLALAVALYLAHARGWPILLLASCGGAAALSYLVPPVHLSYRGLGETVIAASYGPGLTLGSFYLQTGRLGWEVCFASLLPALLMFAMALANEIPDYYGDRLVGKRNLIVRIGRRGGARLYGIVTGLCFCLLAAGLLAGVFPTPLALALLLVPVAFRNGLLALRQCENPPGLRAVVRGAILLYVLVNALAIAGYLHGG